jgi:hypothetical protein
MTDWNSIVQSAKQKTDAQLQTQISGLTSLKEADIEDIIMKTGISGVDLVSILKEVKDATKSNEAKANAIASLDKGVETLVGIASKVI